MAKKIERRTPKYLILGEILRPHGVQGEVRMRIITEYPEQLHQLDSLFIGKSPDDQQLQSIPLTKVRFHKEYALLTFKGYTSRSESDRLRSKLVMIDIDHAVPLEDGEYYLFQLIGLTVKTGDNEIGLIKEVLQTGANDVYIVESDHYGELLIPAHDETIININFDAGIVSMSLPDGLLPPN